MTKKQIFIGLRVAFFCGMIAAMVLTIRLSGDVCGQICERCGGAAPFVTVPIHAFLAAAPVPSDAMCVFNGAAFGYVPGVLLSWLGWMLGAIIEFQFFRSMSGLRAETPETTRLPKWLQRYPAGHPLILILGRQIPAVGADITIIGAAMAGVRWPRFLWCSAVAILPGALLLPAIGAKVALWN